MYRDLDHYDRDREDTAFPTVWPEDNFENVGASYPAPMTPASRRVGNLRQQPAPPNAGDRALHGRPLLG